jgi:hypothetical protein
MTLGEFLEYTAKVNKYSTATKNRMIGGARNYVNRLVRGSYPGHHHPRPVENDIHKLPGNFLLNANKYELRGKRNLNHMVINDITEAYKILGFEEGLIFN